MEVPERNIRGTDKVHWTLPTTLVVRLKREAGKQDRSVTKTAELLLRDALDRQDEAAAGEKLQREIRTVPLEEL